MAFDDSKSGARFERVVLDGERVRAEARRPPRRLDHAPDRRHRLRPGPGVGVGGASTSSPTCIDHATVGAAREARRAARCCMRDVGAWLVPAGRTRRRRRAAPAVPRPPRRAARGARGGGRTTSDCCRSRTATRSSGPARSRARRRSGFPQPVPRIAADGWRRLDDVVPRARRRPPAAATRAVAAVRRARRHARRRSSTATPSSATSGSVPTAARSSSTGRRPAPVPRSPRSRTHLALNRARIPRELGARRHRRRVPRRARTPRRRHRAVVRASARAVPRRRDAAARLGEGVRRDRRWSSRGGATAPSTPPASWCAPDVSVRHVLHCG